MKYVYVVCAALFAASPALAKDESVLVRRETAVTGGLFVRDALGSRIIDCTPAIYARREHGRRVLYRREVDCPYPGANAAVPAIPLHGLSYPRDARFGGYDKRGWIILK